MSPKEPATSEGTLPWSADGEGAATIDPIGKTLGDFLIQRLLGRGGMGEVYLATQISLDRPVAIKILRQDFLSKPAYLKRFEKEGTAIARLNHPNIVHVYTLGSIEGLHFIAMEYVQGTNLRDYIEKKGALDLPLALSIMRQAGQAVGAAGEVGIVHRDIKPENLMLTRKGRVKVADFGLCRDPESEDVRVTQPGVTMGTPLYMSPEQAQGHALDHRSDLYSLGVTFYHMLAGEPPFRAESAIALALKHMKEIPISLRVHRPEIPVELDRLVLKLMAKDPADRYQSASEMLADLAKIRGMLQTATSGVAGSETGFTEIRSGDYQSLADVSSGAEAPAGRSRPSPFRLSLGDNWFRPLTLVLTASVCLAAGGLIGWSRRSPSLSASNLAGARKVPGLWIEARWTSIPRQNSAGEQYRFAQLQAVEEDLAPAWLAVAGNFPQSHEWVSRAYVQLAHLLYRQGDIERLSGLSQELSSWKDAQTRDQELIEIIDCGIKLLKRDLDGVIEGMTRVSSQEDRTIYDPGLLEFSVEIVADALKQTYQPDARARTMERPKLVRIQGRLMPQLLFIRSLDLAGRGRAG